jgi:multiple sugar transport system permease protein
MKISMKRKPTAIDAQDRTIKLLMLPLFLTIILVSTLPLLLSVLAAFSDWSAGIDVPINFIGIENFRYMASDYQFFASFKLGLVWTILVTTLTTAMGVGLALLLNQEKRYMVPLKVIALSPWSMSPPAIAVIWTTLMNPNSGPVNQFLRALKLPGGNIGFLEDPTLFFPTLVVIGAWALMPMITVAVLAALKTIPKELEESMEMDGANGLRKFRYLILPHIQPILVPLVALNIIWNFGAFDLIYVIVGSFPPPNSEIPIVFAFRQAFKYGQFGYASALGVAIAIFEISLVLVILRRQFKAMSAQ